MSSSLNIVHQYPASASPPGFGTFLIKLGALAALALATWGVLAAGTAWEHERFTVVGRIHCDGRPAAGAQVKLYRLGTEPNLSRATAWGTVARDGRFDVRTLGFAEGAPAGKYAVTVAYEPPIIHGEDFVPGPNVLAPKLADPQTTPLVVEIRRATNDLGLLLLGTPQAPQPNSTSPRWNVLSDASQPPSESPSTSREL
jgi:hypothetical protein